MENNLEYYILNAIDQTNTPVGAHLLAEIVPSSQASIGRVLIDLEEKGYLSKAGNKGRILTEEGKIYLSQLQQSMESQQYADFFAGMVASPNREFYKYTLEVRMILERRAAELAAATATEEDIDALERLVSQNRRSWEQGNAGVSENLAFHYRIAELSGNPVLANTLKMIMPQKSAYIHYSLVDFQETSGKRESKYFHHKIVAAIKAHDSVLAGNLMWQHLNTVKEELDALEKIAEEI